MKSLIDRLMTRSREEGPRQPDFSILFVCMGNICRSPTAEGVFKKLVLEQLPNVFVDVDSAGTHAYHDGEPPDRRARRAAARRGFDLETLRARRVTEDDFGRFDLVLAMDQLNQVVLAEHCPPEYRDRIRLFLEFAPGIERVDVPDPYYGGSNGFEYVLDLAEEGSNGLIEHVRSVVLAKT